ncbi:MAG: DUF4190 domain-containing protein [Streptosporangiaceae bacterium]
MNAGGPDDPPPGGTGGWESPTQPDRSPGELGQYPGEPGQYPGEPGQYPGEPGQYPAEPGQYPAQPDPYPGQYAGYGSPVYQPQPFGRTNPLAIGALVCGIGQFLLGLLIVGNILLAVPALVLGVVGLRQISTRGERGKGMAIAGVVLGALGIVYFGLVLILVVAGISASN